MAMRDHAWRYFELHAKQRMAVFNFFLILSGLVAAGLAASFQGPGPLPLIGAVLGLLLALVSFVFWKLDQRVSFLIKHAENTLVTLDKESSQPCKGLFAEESILTEHATCSGSLWMRQWTYGRSFRLVFVVMGVYGFVGGFISFSRYAGFLHW